MNVKLPRRIGKKYDIPDRKILQLSLKQNLLRNYHNYPDKLSYNQIHDEMDKLYAKYWPEQVKKWDEAKIDTKFSGDIHFPKMRQSQ